MSRNYSSDEIIPILMAMTRLNIFIHKTSFIYYE